MALNQPFHSPPGSAPLAVVEQKAEPGRPSLYWSGKEWGTAKVEIPLVPDPALASSGGFVLQVPTALTASWPDRIYWIHFIDHNSAGKDEFLEQRPVSLFNGDDGGLGLPAISIPLSGFAAGGVAASGTVKLYGAVMVPTPGPTS